MLLVSVLAGCGERPSARTEPLGAAKGTLEIGYAEQPETLVSTASRRLIDNISAADIGEEFGVPDARTPYPDTYWPFAYGGTDLHWYQRGSDPRSPIEKYMAITAPEATYFAKAWEHNNHGMGAPALALWNGHCPGWAGAATNNAPILHRVFAGPDGRGGIAKCTEGTSGCVRFEIGDVNALMAEVYVDSPVVIIGSTCGTRPYDIPYDWYGRVLKDGCRGVNPGSLIIAVSTLLRRHQIPFAMAAQNENTTDQIWTQPTYRYYVYDFQPLTRAAAVNLVTRSSIAGPDATYVWNPAAQGFAFMDLGLRFVGEDKPHVELLSGLRSTYEMRVTAVLELDADASDPNAKILGGEYVAISNRETNRLTVPPFIWVARGMGPDDLPFYVGSNHHNPFIRPSVVKQLIVLGQQPE
ncbi:Hypothetical protein A7982_07843 [Minicystis rosea]|nr:Hypothetical protein A7982_07843 [Minicystis rosea]